MVNSRLGIAVFVAFSRTAKLARYCSAIRTTDQKREAENGQAPYKPLTTVATFTRISIETGV